MILDLLEQLTGEWRGRLEEAGCVLRKPLYAMKASGSHGHDRKVNLLIFEAGGREPILLLKLARSTAYDLRLQEEYQALSEISIIKGLSQSTPRPVGLFRYRQRPVLIQHYLPGIPLSVFLRRHKRTGKTEVERDLSTAMNWLLKFQKETLAGQEVPVERLIDCLQVLKNTYPDHSLAPEFVRSLVDLIQEYEGLQIPLVACHGDFWPGNFLLRTDSVGVIDWESFHRKETPYQDAFMFLTTYARTYPWTEWRWSSKISSFEQSFLQRNWFSQILKQQIQRYLRALNVPYVSSHLLYSIFLIRMACIAPGLDRDETQARSWFEFLKFYSENWKRSIFVI